MNNITDETVNTNAGQVSRAAGETAGYPTICKGRYDVGGRTFYAIEEPFPMCVASCAAEADGTPCSCFGAYPCGTTCVTGACSDGGGC